VSDPDLNDGQEQNLGQEDPLSIPDILEVYDVFPDQDPAVLYDYYCQVGRKKDLLIETIMNGGLLPE